MNKTALYSMIGLVFALAASSANATLINFMAMADGTEWGESGYSSLDVGILSVTAEKNGSSAFAYLDRGTAGLGVCGLVNNTGKAGNSGSNRCSSGASDDNVTNGEKLIFKFDDDVTITNIWFNNNHDGGFQAGEYIDINGADYQAIDGVLGGLATDLTKSYGFGSFNVAANTAFNVSFFDNLNNIKGAIGEQFYVSAIEFETRKVPAPGSLALFGLGLAGLGYMRKKK